MPPSVLNTPTSVVSPLPTPNKKQEPELREIGDSTSLRTTIYDDVLNAARTMEPVTNKRHTLRLSNVNYADKGDFSFRQQKDAILGGKSLNRRIRGTWQLVDNDTGETLDQREATVAHVPYLSNRGTTIHGGNEYTLSNQMRLRSGIYTRIKDNGEIEAHANILPGKGVSMFDQPSVSSGDTPPHQDNYYIGGSDETWTTWIPTGDCSAALGSLAVASGTHKLGKLAVQQTANRGVAVILPDDITWAGGDFHCGDVLAFHSLTIHQGQDNESGNRLRMSLDYLYQPISHPVRAD